MRTIVKVYTIHKNIFFLIWYYYYPWCCNNIIVLLFEKPLRVTVSICKLNISSQFAFTTYCFHGLEIKDSLLPINISIALFSLKR